MATLNLNSGSVPTSMSADSAHPTSGTGGRASGGRRKKSRKAGGSAGKSGPTSNSGSKDKPGKGSEINTALPSAKSANYGIYGNK